MVEVLQILRALHILFAVAWMGGGAYAFSVILNGARRDEAGDSLLASFYATGRHGPFMGITATGTILFGGAVMGMGEYSSEAMGGMGGPMVLGLSMTLAVGAYFVGILGHVPTEKKLQGLARTHLQGAEAGSEYPRLLARDHKLAHVSMALMGLALLGMLTFRFF